MKQLHTTDIVAGDGQKMRQQMAENFEIIQQEDAKLQGRTDSLNRQVTGLKAQVNQLKIDDEDHRKRLERIERVLFSTQSINTAELSTADDNEHHGYEVADAPVGNYLEEIN